MFLLKHTSTTIACTTVVVPMDNCLSSTVSNQTETANQKLMLSDQSKDGGYQPLCISSYRPKSAKWTSCVSLDMCMCRRVSPQQSRMGGQSSHSLRKAPSLGFFRLVDSFLYTSIMSTCLLHAQVWILIKWIAHIEHLTAVFNSQTYIPMFNLVAAWLKFKVSGIIVANVFFSADSERYFTTLSIQHRISHTVFKLAHLFLAWPLKGISPTTCRPT